MDFSDFLWLIPYAPPIIQVLLLWETSAEPLPGPGAPPPGSRDSPRWPLASRPQPQTEINLPARLRPINWVFQFSICQVGGSGSWVS